MAIGADRDFADLSGTLHLPDGRQKLIVRDHAPADDENGRHKIRAIACSVSSTSLAPCIADK